jgi:CRP-like cAMP-binding protein
MKMAEDGRELMTGIYQAEDFLGINTILSNNEHEDTATTLEDSCLCFPKTQFDEMLTVSRCCRKFLEILSHEIRKRMGIFCSLPTNLFGFRRSDSTFIQTTRRWN